MMTWLRALRVNQWTKNGVLAAALVFAAGDHTQDLPPHALLTVGLAILIFCLTSSAVYLLNDLHDLEKDRAHPRKKFRPLAAGRISRRQAATVSALLFAVGIGSGLMLHRDFGTALLVYVLLQFLYTFALKHIALVDVFVIAIGFVLRALSGALVLSVPISPWLLLCTLLLALFLALCKRRHEKTASETDAHISRPSLNDYDSLLLDLLIAIVCSATITCYAIYTLWPDTVEKFGSTHLSYTVVFVMFGLFRYLDLVYRHESGERPEKVLLTDVPTLINLALYGLSLLGILFPL